MSGNLNERQEEVSKDSIISSAQNYIGSMLKALPQKLKESTGEVALNIICDEINKMPVPLLGTVLASTIRRTFGEEQGMGRNYSDAIDMLSNIQASTSSFENELMSYNIQMDEITNEISLLRQLLMEKKESSCLKMVRPTITLDYPQGNNEIQFILANTGSGSIIVEEIFLEVEKWEPDTTIDYSLPAAPLNFVMLEAELSVHETQYPLLKLNNEPELTFSAKGEGADKIAINISSQENACYSLRLRMPYFDIVTEESDTLYYPAIGEEPFVVPFYFAPGWKHLEPANLLGRELIFQELKEKFQTILSIFENHSLSDPLREQKNREMLEEFQIWYDPDNSMRRTFYFLSIFVPPFTSMAVLERKQEAVELILKLLCHEAEYFDEQVRNEYRNTIEAGNTEYYVPEYFSDILMLINDPGAEQFVKDLMLETEFSQRIALTDLILSKMKPLD
ncbi:hypothetical protein SAMN04488587_1329 [Methanococcoides vulcani]|uniref:Uncharacterized protein n=1 Tax=Methanococcoides vulcani TaxID=1353158 RepID=A0A1H9ZWV7_9EURY|nr:hypothetical protein [Methanococcoides vulcani]SES86193.1 hypothetical protein SAMN04488587_1329 [Methanococcoides vulcani]